MATMEATPVCAMMPHRLPGACEMSSTSTMRKCASTPALRSLGDPACEDGLEVYVVLRNFKEFAGGVFHRLPVPIRDGVRDCGVCHYMTVFKKPDGSLVQFDFGPSAGGDIHISKGPFASLLHKEARAHSAATRVEGKVRERKLTHLPRSHMFVGRTPLSLSDVRAWNNIHAASQYELHRSDCRHYVNSLVHYTTGMERATTSALQNQWTRNRERYGLAECVVRLGQYMTDVANWDRVRAVGNATSAALMTLTGHQALARLRAVPLVRSVQQRLLPAARNALVPVRRAVVQRPLAAVGTAAVATTYAASGGGQTPAAIRETITMGARVASGVQGAVRAAASLAEHLGRSASIATQQTTNHAVALATGIAGAASRGAVNLMVARPRTVAAVGSVEARTTTQGSPLRAMLPNFRSGSRTQQLALVAARR